MTKRRAGAARGGPWAVAGAIAALALAGGQALAASATVAGVATTFVPSNPSIPQGGTIDFRNDDPERHDLTARLKGPDGARLFASETFSGPGVTRPVGGVQFLPQGSYEFICTVHATEMQGTLTVTAAGTPVPRPEIEVAIDSRKLAKVVNQKMLNVSVKAASPTDADDVNLSAKKGSRPLTKGTNLDMNAGSRERVALKLTRGGVKALEDLDQARITLTGTVRFGSRDRATKKLK